MSRFREAFKRHISPIIWRRKAMGRIEFYLYPKRRFSWGGPFNGQEGRQEIFKSIVSACRPTAIVETGTYRATTTRFMALSTALPIYTVEYNIINVGFAEENLRGIKNVHLCHGDSRSFLLNFVATAKAQHGQILFYLDAHWSEDLPLAEEIEIIFSANTNSIVMIDDFQVPWDPGYKYDDYGPCKGLTLELIADASRKFGLSRFFPSLPASSETGRKRGCVVLASNHEIVSKLAGISSLRFWGG